MQIQLLESGIEAFLVDGEEVCREVRLRDGSSVISRLPILASPEERRLWSADALHDASWLRTRTPPANSARELVRVVDLFAGCGGLTLGIQEAARALGIGLHTALAMDIDEEALRTYGRNFPDAGLVTTPIQEILRPIGTDRTAPAERALAAKVGEVDLLVGGPPCQGHSDLNNYTRRQDPKNELYALMARFCELIRPTHVVIENVPGVERDSSRVAQRTWGYLRDLGYQVDSAVIAASEVGTAQLRKRSFTLASLKVAPFVKAAIADVAVPPRSLRWAISDLIVDPENDPFDTPPRPSAENARRIESLFDNDIFDLPDEERPACHRLKSHSYVSMYGRLRWDVPAPTITTGFGSMGRGRWVHPAEQRTITPHEAARIQGFPDYFRFDGANRTLLHKLIGNAVPPKLGYAVGLHLLR